MVKAGLANLLLNLTAKPTSVEQVVVTQMGECDEIERYLRLPEIPLQTSSGHGQDILYWWKTHSSEFPNLSKMARHFWAALASSASAERLFSATCKMHDDLKKSTFEDTLEDMLIVAKNFRDA